MFRIKLLNTPTIVVVLFITSRNNLCSLFLICTFFFTCSSLEYSLSYPILNDREQPSFFITDTFLLFAIHKLSKNRYQSFLCRKLGLSIPSDPHLEINLPLMVNFLICLKPEES